MQPHFALSAIIALGLRGIAKKLPLTFPPVVIQQEQGDNAEVKRLAVSLEAATTAMMREGSVARECFGDLFVDHFGGTRLHEIKVWNEAVTNWERQCFSLVLSWISAHACTLLQWRDTWNSRDRTLF